MTDTYSRFGKTDNRRLDVKVKLRRQVLDEAGIRDARVLDLCAGEGHIWRAMRSHVKVTSYVPVDREPRMTGTIKGDVRDTRFLSAFNVSKFNVIDVDTYGEPWETWHFLAPQLKRRTAVFLTVGMVNGVPAAGGAGGGTITSKYALRALGIPEDWHVPNKRALAEFAADYCLHASTALTRIGSAYRAALRNVTYYGLIALP